MADQQEVFMFLKELGRLLDDYNKCNEESLREEIYNDILLFSEVIDDDKHYSDGNQ